MNFHVLRDQLVLICPTGKLMNSGVWLLFYSAPILVKVLLPLFFHHYSLLVCAMHIFFSKEIIEADCDLAEQMFSV